MGFGALAREDLRQRLRKIGPVLAANRTRQEAAVQDKHVPSDERRLVRAEPQRAFGDFLWRSNFPRIPQRRLQPRSRRSANDGGLVQPACCR
jgi:hypothetical protein